MYHRLRMKNVTNEEAKMNFPLANNCEHLASLPWISKVAKRLKVWSKILVLNYYAFLEQRFSLRWTCLLWTIKNHILVFPCSSCALILRIWMKTILSKCVRMISGFSGLCLPVYLENKMERMTVKSRTK